MLQVFLPHFPHSTRMHLFFFRQNKSERGTMMLKIVPSVKTSVEKQQNITQQKLK